MTLLGVFDLIGNEDAMEAGFVMIMVGREDYGRPMNGKGKGCHWLCSI